MFFLRILFLLTPLTVFSVYEMVDLTPEDQDKLALVHVRDMPFERVMIPGNRVKATHKDAPISYLMPQSRLSLHFCLNNMVPDIVHDDGNIDSWDSMSRYAVILPCTPTVMNQAQSYTLNDITLFGPLELPDNALFVYPTGVEKSSFGTTYFYDEKKTSLRSVIKQVLEDNKKFIIEHSYYDRQLDEVDQKNTVTGHAYLGQKQLNPLSLWTCYPGLEGKSFEAHSQSSFQSLEDLIHSTFLLLFTGRAHFSLAEAFRREYWKLFFGTCLREKIHDFEEVINVLRGGLKSLHPPQPTMDLFESRADAYLNFYQHVWKIEKKLVLETNQSFLVRPDVVSIFQKIYDSSLPDLALTLNSLAVPYDLKQEIHKENATKMSFSFVGFQENDNNKFFLASLFFNDEKRSSSDIFVEFVKDCHPAILDYCQRAFKKESFIEACETLFDRIGIAFEED
jgi:hypothetical protein